MKFEGHKITVFKHSFLPKKTIALSSDLFDKIRKEQNETT